MISAVIEHMNWSGTAASLASDPGPAAPLRLPPSAVACSNASASASAAAAASTAIAPAAVAILADSRALDAADTALLQELSRLHIFISEGGVVPSHLIKLVGLHEVLGLSRRTTPLLGQLRTDGEVALRDALAAIAAELTELLREAYCSRSTSSSYFREIESALLYQLSLLHYQMANSHEIKGDHKCHRIRMAAANRQSNAGTDAPDLPPLAASSSAETGLQPRGQGVETKPAETKPIKTTPAETKPAETKPVETTPVETTPAEATPTEAKACPGPGGLQSDRNDQMPPPPPPPPSFDPATALPLAPTDERAASSLGLSCHAAATCVGPATAQFLVALNDPAVASATIGNILSTHAAMSAADKPGQTSVLLDLIAATPGAQMPHAGAVHCARAGASGSAAPRQRRPHCRCYPNFHAMLLGTGERCVLTALKAGEAAAAVVGLTAGADPATDPTPERRDAIRDQLTNHAEIQAVAAAAAAADAAAIPHDHAIVVAVSRPMCANCAHAMSAIATTLGRAIIVLASGDPIVHVYFG